MSAWQQFSRPRSFPLISHQRDSHHFIGFEVQRRADDLFCETKCFVLFYHVFFYFFLAPLRTYFLFVALEHFPCYKVIRGGRRADCTSWQISRS